MTGICSGRLQLFATAPMWYSTGHQWQATSASALMQWHHCLQNHHYMLRSVAVIDWRNGKAGDKVVLKTANCLEQQSVHSARESAATSRTAVTGSACSRVSGPSPTSPLPLYGISFSVKHTNVQIITNKKLTMYSKRAHSYFTILLCAWADPCPLRRRVPSYCLTKPMTLWRVHCMFCSKHSWDHFSTIEQNALAPCTSVCVFKSLN